jgi:hypothetical protein
VDRFTVHSHSDDFLRRIEKASGQIESICLRCFATVARSGDLADVISAENQHVCPAGSNPESPRRHHKIAARAKELLRKRSNFAVGPVSRPSRGFSYPGRTCPTRLLTGSRSRNFFRSLDFPAAAYTHTPGLSGTKESRVGGASEILSAFTTFTLPLRYSQALRVSRVQTR